MNTIELRNEAIEYAKKAVECEDTEKYEDAIKFYKKSINNLEIVIQQDENKYTRDTYTTKKREYNDRVEYLEKFLNSKKTKKEAVGGK